MEKLLNKSFEARAEVNELGRLKRPIAVAVVGSFVSLAVGVLALAHADGRDEGLIAAVIVVGIGVPFSIAYAIIGGCISKHAANRLLRIVGTLLMLAGVGYLVYLVKSGPV